MVPLRSMTEIEKTPTEPRRNPNRGAFERTTWALHIFLLFNVAVAVPLYTVLAEGGEFFLAHSFSAWYLVLFAVGFSVGAPLAIVLVVGSVRYLGARIFATSVLWVLAALIFLFVLMPLSKLGLGASAALLVSLVVSFGLCAAYVRSKDFRSVLTALAWIALVFPLYFLFGTPIRALIFPSGATQVDARAQMSIERDDVPVFLLVFDEFSSVAIVDERGLIDAGNFPNFDRLANSAYWFRNATTNSTPTELAIPTILTGRLPEKGRLPILDQYPVNIFNLLAPRYEVIAFEETSQLCAQEICGAISRSPELWPFMFDLAIVYAHTVTPDELGEHLPTIAGRWAGFADERTDPEADATPGQGEQPPKRIGPRHKSLQAKRRFEQFVALIDEQAEGRLHFIHTLLPHVPYVFLPDGRLYTLYEGMDNLPGWRKGRWAPDEALVKQGYQRALLQTQFVDRLIGLFLDRLQELEIFQDALIVVTADHGVNFMPRAGRRGFGPSTQATGLAVPLFVKLPGQERGEISDRNVQTIDILPTILSILGEVERGVFYGTDAFGAPSAEPPNKTVLRWTGEKVEIEADMTPRIRAAAQEKIDLFESVDGTPDHYRLAPFGAYIGRRLGRFSMAGSQKASAQEIKVILESSGAMQAVDPTSEFIPAYLQGRIDGNFDALGAKYLAIAMDDRIAAIAPIFRKGKQVRFSGIVHPKYFRKGVNQPSFFAMAGNPQQSADAEFRLHALASSAGPGYQLSEAGQLISASSDPLQEARLFAGSIRLSQATSHGFRISGWVSGGPRKSAIARKVLIFADQRLLHTVTPAKGNTGLSVFLPLQVFAAGDERLRVFAVFEDETFAEYSIEVGEDVSFPVAANISAPQAGEKSPARK